MRPSDSQPQKSPKANRSFDKSEELPADARDQRDAPARWESIFGPLRAGLVDDLVVVAQSVGGH
jgi:hypothetical protein